MLHLQHAAQPAPALAGCLAADAPGSRGLERLALWGQPESKASAPDMLLSLLTRRTSPGRLPGPSLAREKRGPALSHRGLVCKRSSAVSAGSGAGSAGTGLWGAVDKPCSSKAARAPVQCSTKRWAMSTGTAIWPP